MGELIDIGGGIRLACTPPASGWRPTSPPTCTSSSAPATARCWEEPELWNRVVGDWIAAR
ncbi:MAG TPA: hypothetical protein VJN72_10250 [Gaiellales bacterium]|nr:hypothetical protein [Gaiellales bacterium]